MAGGTLDTIVARVEAYMGEFLQTRSQLLDARNRIGSALSTAQSTGGSAKIGEKIYTVEQLNALYAENDSLLARNADLQNQLLDFKDKVSSISETLAPAEADYGNYPPAGMLGNPMGFLPVAIPATALIATGAVLATAVYLFLSSVKSHLSNVAGDVGGNLLLYGGIALAGYFYLKHRKIL
jgi:hypothetical protein